MKNIQLTMAMLALILLVGCDKKTESTTGGNSANTTKVSALDTDVCGKCGCCAGCADCCNAASEKCSCGFNKGSLLCCVEGVKPGDATYCKKCGHVKGSESCCAEGNTVCAKCGLAKGAPLCCKLKDKTVDAASHDHGDEAKDKGEVESAAADKSKEEG